MIKRFGAGVLLAGQGLALAVLVAGDLTWTDAGGAHHWPIGGFALALMLAGRELGRRR